MADGPVPFLTRTSIFRLAQRGRAGPTIREKSMLKLIRDGADIPQVVNSKVGGRRTAFSRRRAEASERPSASQARQTDEPDGSTASSVSIFPRVSWVAWANTATFFLGLEPYWRDTRAACEGFWSAFKRGGFEVAQLRLRKPARTAGVPRQCPHDDRRRAASAPEAIRDWEEVQAGLNPIRRPYSDGMDQSRWTAL